MLVNPRAINTRRSARTWASTRCPRRGREADCQARRAPFRTAQDQTPPAAETLGVYPIKNLHSQRLEHTYLQNFREYYYYYTDTIHWNEGGVELKHASFLHLFIYLHRVLCAWLPNHSQLLNPARTKKNTPCRVRTCDLLRVKET